MIIERMLQKVRVIAKPGAVGGIPELLQKNNYHKPFVVYDKGLAKTPIIPNILGILEEARISYIPYHDITPDPKATQVDHGVELFQVSNCDCIIAIGGGSAMDAAKGINVVCHNGGKILDYPGQEEKITESGALICIPTTSGTGSELSNWSVISDEEHEKHPINVLNAMAAYAILDPELVLDLPAQITAATGFDVFSHAFEAYTSICANFDSDPICEKIMETVVRYLPRAVKDGHDMEARKRMMVAASYGGYVMVDNLVEIGHCIGHEIGGTFGIPHGAAVSYAFPAMVKHIVPACPEKIRYVGELLGATFQGDESEAGIASRTARAYKIFRDDTVGLRPISSYHPDLKKVNLDMAERIYHDPIRQMAPVETTVEDIMYMLYTIFKQ